MNHRTKILIICESNFNQNTQKIALAMQNVLKAPIVKPDELEHIDIMKYDVIGMGSGIKFARHDERLLEAVRNFPMLNKKVFIFSTRCNLMVGKYHNSLKKILQEKGCAIIGEFSTFGYDCTGPFAIMGGFHKGRPNENDLRKAEKFAKKLNIVPTKTDPLKNKKMKKVRREQNYDVFKGCVDGKLVEVHGKMVSVNWSTCAGCKTCMEVCPLEVFKVKSIKQGENQIAKVAPVNEDDCVLCRKCERACPANAITIRFSWKEAIAVVKKHEKFYEK